MGTIFYLMMGWCGTKYPGWWRNPNPPGPYPEPWRNYGVATIIGIVGVVGGTLFSNAINDNTLFPDKVLLHLDWWLLQHLELLLKLWGM